MLGYYYPERHLRTDGHHPHKASSLSPYEKGFDNKMVWQRSLWRIAWEVYGIFWGVFWFFFCVRIRNVFGLVFYNWHVHNLAQNLHEVFQKRKVRNILVGNETEDIYLENL